jgi:2-hydroxychromene-2-carboxylate isomerase
MKPPLEFYFDFSSPYGYIASRKIEALASKQGRSVNWHPVLLGAVFKITGGRPLPDVPLKGEYSKRDIERSARFHGVPFRMPEPFPVSTVAACRAFYAVKDGIGLSGRFSDKSGPDPQFSVTAVELAKALFRAYFVENVNISDAENVAKVAASVGCDVRAALNDQAVKERTKAEVDSAIAKGVFGSPYIVVDGEPFWGIDRFDQIERWLTAPF